MDATLLQQQLVSCIADLAPATGAWSWTPAEGEDPVAIVGTAGTLLATDPRLAGVSDRHIALRVATSTMPEPRPKRSAVLMRAGRRHTLVRDPDDEPHGITTILLTA